MKRALVFIIGALLCLPTAFGAPRNGATLLGLILIAAVTITHFILENERNNS